MSAHSLTSAVGIGSRSDDLVLDDLRILRIQAQKRSGHCYYSSVL